MDPFLCICVYLASILSYLIAGRLHWAEEDCMQLAAELVEGLTGMGRLQDAAIVSVQHLRNTDAAVQLFCSAHEWRQVVANHQFQGSLSRPCGNSLCMHPQEHQPAYRQAAVQKSLPT